MNEWPKDVQKAIDLENQALALAHLLAPRRFDSKKLMQVYSSAVERYHRRNRVANLMRSQAISRDAK